MNGSGHEDYSHRRPHSSLGMKAPANFARDWREGPPPVSLRSPSALAPRHGHTTTLQPPTNHQLSQQVDR